MINLLLALSVATAQSGSAAPLMVHADVVRPLGSRTTEEQAVRKAVTDVYAVISGPAGQKRDWNRMKTLFTPDARLYAVGRQGLQGGSVDDYISRSGATLERVGFTERELTRRIEIYGSVAQVWSSYAGTSTDGSVNVRGINSFQLARQVDGRWLVHSIFWQAENPALPLPTDMEAR